ncbi:hypothetical protein F4808DRAFT_51642 [Astrocystis sublimbata]|nr:hypothetical protein F4808DRAFT_51642 [Astrocystis sublimbata]
MPPRYTSRPSRRNRYIDKKSDSQNCLLAEWHGPRGKVDYLTHLGPFFLQARPARGSFFFKRGEGDRGGVSKFVTTIAAQLIRGEPAFAIYLRDVIETNTAIDDNAMREQCDKLIFEPLSKLPPRDRTTDVLIIVIDALDECDREEDIELLIHLLSGANASKSTRLRIFLTSRPKLPIRLGFHKIQGAYPDLILYEVEQSNIEYDFTVYGSWSFARPILEWGLVNLYRLEAGLSLFWHLLRLAAGE